MYDRLNLGCGSRLIDGYINIDGSWNVLLSKVPWAKRALRAIGVRKIGEMPDLDRRITRLTLPEGLRRFRNGSADRIFTSHFIEHVPHAKAMRTLEECFRILCSGGLLRVVAPDAIWYCREYVRDTENALREGRRTSEFKDLLVYSLFSGWMNRHARNGHYSVWDVPSMCDALQRVGFRDITVCEFQKGRDPAMAMMDNHGHASFFIEAVKS
jgi:Uncharacterized protein conserved in bacteria